MKGEYLSIETLKMYQDIEKENKELYKSIEKAICYLANCDWNNKEFYDLYSILIGEDKDE